MTTGRDFWFETALDFYSDYPVQNLNKKQYDDAIQGRAAGITLSMRVAILHYERVQAARTMYRLACRIRRIRSQTYHERLDCLQAIRDAKQGSFLPLIVDADERIAATNLCGHHMMAIAVESEKLRWADPLEFRQRSANVGCRPEYCLRLHHREAIASFRLSRRLP